jgi:hypothetical protein
MEDELFNDGGVGAESGRVSLQGCCVASLYTTSPLLVAHLHSRLTFLADRRNRVADPTKHWIQIILNTGAGS